MRRATYVATALLVSCVASVLALSQLVSSGETMTDAAREFIALLSEDQRAKTVLAYDIESRTDWHYIPKSSRKGLQLGEMNQEQRQAAHALLRAALSASGYQKTSQIMQLESVLVELEGNRGRFARDPLRYYVTIFGQPAASGRWGLSVEGHHLSLNFVVRENRVAASTPTFLGANPAMLMADYDPEQPKGLRVLKAEEDLAFRLLESLDEGQRKAAVTAERAPNDVRGATEAAPPRSPPAGIPAVRLNEQQKQLLRDLIEVYARSMPADVAAQRLAAIDAEGVDGIHFAWQGGDQLGVGHAYQVQGKSSLIEFNNTQPDSAGNRANHIHSVWHNLAGNFDIPVEMP